MRDNRCTIIKIFKFRIYNCKDKESAAHTMHKNAERCLVRKTSFDYRVVDLQKHRYFYCEMGVSLTIQSTMVRWSLS